MITFKIQGAKHRLPTAWGDVTYSQYIALLSTPNSLIHYINLFTKIGLETLEKAEMNNVEKIALALSFLTIPPVYEPKAISVGKYYIPKDVTIESLGQFEDLRVLCSRRPPDLSTTENQLLLHDLMLEACAVYIQKIKDGKYDPNKVPQVKEDLKEESCIEVIQTGSFFLFKPLNTSTNIRQRFQTALLRLKRSLVDLPGYQKSLDFLLRSSGSQEK